MLKYVYFKEMKDNQSFFVVSSPTNIVSIKFTDQLLLVALRLLLSADI